MGGQDEWEGKKNAGYSVMYEKWKSANSSSLLEMYRLLYVLSRSAHSRGMLKTCGSHRTMLEPSNIKAKSSIS